MAKGDSRDKTKYLYWRCGELITELIDRLSARYKPYKERPVEEVHEEYARAFNVSVATIRAWKIGRSRPNTDNEGEIERLCRDGIERADLGGRWLRSFLEQVGAPQGMRQHLLSELLSKSASTQRRIEINFPNGAYALARHVDYDDDLAEALDEIGVPRQRPTLLFIGGAARLEYDRKQPITELIEQAIAPICQEHNVAMVDGATKSGIFSMIGRARGKIGGNFPLVGVAPASKIYLPTDEHIDSERVDLDENHSHFVLTPGAYWKDASPWMSRVARAIAGRQPAVTVLINGGEVAWIDAMCSMTAGITVITLRDSGRTADSLAEAVRLAAEINPQQSLFKPEAVHVAELHKPDELRMLLARFFS
jgi:hypothetical protein